MRSSVRIPVQILPHRRGLDLESARAQLGAVINMLTVHRCVRRLSADKVYMPSRIALWRACKCLLRHGPVTDENNDDSEDRNRRSWNGSLVYTVER